MALNILVTGGQGFIGSRLVDILSLNKDYNIVVVDNLLADPKHLIEFDSNNVSFIEADIRDNIKGILRDVDLVVHLAAIVGYESSELDKEFTYDVNVNGVENMIKLLSPSQKIIFMSSTSCYGDRNGKITNETSPLLTNSTYGITKAIAEQIVKRHHQYIIFRPATAFGVSRQIRTDLLPNTLSVDALVSNRIILFDYQVIRPFIHVDDIVRAISWAITGKLSSNSIYNLGDPELNLSKLELAVSISNLTGAEVVLSNKASSDQRNYSVDFSKIQKYGFKHTLEIEYGFNQIKENIDAIKANSEIYTRQHLTKLFISKQG